MRLNWFITTSAILGLLVGCSPKSQETAAITANRTNVVAGVKPDDLLLRVRFAGMAAMMADTNAAYLTNFASLPETTALGKRIAEKMATLPERFVVKSQSEGERQENRKTDGADAPQATLPGKNEVQALAGMFGDLLQTGFTLELHGDANDVTTLMLAAKSAPETTTRWSHVLEQCATAWFGSPPSNTTPTVWTAGQGAMTVQNASGWMAWTLTKEASRQSFEISAPFPALGDANKPKSSSLMEAELTSSLLPKPIQRSVYGEFSQLKFFVVPAEQSLKIRGTATYEHNLPTLTNRYAVPARLIHEPLVSFTVVRNPSAWLAGNSPIRSILPQTLPETIYFWGQGQLPGQFYAAMPFDDKDRFSSGYGAELVTQLTRLSAELDAGKVWFDTNSPAIRWQGIPFLTPEITVTNDGGGQFVRAGLFPDSGLTNSLPEPFVNQVADRTDLVLYDWEITGPRLFGWLYIGQLGLMLSKHDQLGTATSSAHWILAAQKAFGNGNTITEITQTGPRELTIARRAPLGLTSLEILWLANWLESSNFPAANFLMPVPKP